VLRNLYEVVLNKVIDPGSVTTNVDYEHVTELTKFNVDAFIKTPVVSHLLFHYSILWYGIFYGMEFWYGHIIMEL
jgi:hypothetical protein